MDAENLHRRLKKIIGQVQAIERMIDEDVPCEEVLSQINAAKSALNGCGKVVPEGHIKHCVRDGIEHGDAEKTIESFTKAVERFANMQQFLKDSLLRLFFFLAESIFFAKFYRPFFHGRFYNAAYRILFVKSCVSYANFIVGICRFVFPILIFTISVLVLNYCFNNGISRNINVEINGQSA